METIKYNDFLELSKKIFLKSKEFENKVLMVVSPQRSLDNPFDASFFLTYGIDFTDYCLLDPIFQKYKIYNKSQINKLINTEEIRNNGVTGYVIYQPNKFNEYAGQVHSYN